MDRAQLKDRAKQVITRQKWITVLVAFILSFCGGSAIPTFSYNFNTNNNSGDYYYYSGINSIPLSPSKFSGAFAVLVVAIVIVIFLVRYLLLSVIKVGGLRYFLKLRKNENTYIDELTGNFKDGNYKNITVTLILQQIFTFLWSLLFVIPGIIKAFEYMMIPYILAVRPNLDRKSCFEMSKKMMDGHKMDAFVLSLSFFGWFILSAFTCGILYIVYVAPYYQATFAEFYGEVREDALRRGIITYGDLPDYGDNFNPMNNGFNQGFNNGFDNGFNNQYYTGENFKAYDPYAKYYEAQESGMPPQEPIAPQTPPVENPPFANPPTENPKEENEPCNPFDEQ